jgi:hypothetical protein
MINGSPPVPFCTRKFRTSIAPRRCNAGMLKICLYAHANTLYGLSKSGISRMDRSLLRNLFSTRKFCMSIAPQCHALACQIYHIIGHVTVRGVAIIILILDTKTHRWGNLGICKLRTSIPAQPECAGMLKHCHNTHLNILYCPSKFGTRMINGSHPVALSTRKFRKSIAPQRCMLAC